MTSQKFLRIQSLALSRIGRTTKPVGEPDIRELSQYFRDRTDASSVPDIRRWR